MPREPGSDWLLTALVVLALAAWPVLDAGPQLLDAAEGLLGVPHLGGLC